MQIEINANDSTKPDLDPICLSPCLLCRPEVMVHFVCLHLNTSSVCWRGQYHSVYNLTCYI